MAILKGPGNIYPHINIAAVVSQFNNNKRCLKEGYLIRKHVSSIILLFLVLICTAIIPTQAAQAADPEDVVLVQSTQASDVQLQQKYLANLDYYMGSIDDIFGAQAIEAVKQFQVKVSMTVDGIVGADPANTLLQQESPAPPAPVTPSRGAISRASLSRSSQDIDCLARTVYGEARGESFEGQVAVAAVVLNRVESGRFGNGIREVIFQPNAFTAVRDGQYYLQPNAASYEAAQAALNGWDPTNGAVYYWNPVTATSRWVRTRTVINTIGNHVFAV